MARVKLGADDDEITVKPANGVILSTPVVPERLDKKMSLDQMQPNPANPRSSELEVEEMASDLQANGQLQNVNVMSLDAFVVQKPYLADKLGPERYVVINGCRRLAGAKKADLAGLRYEIHDEWTSAQIDLAMIRENVHRLDLNPLRLGIKLAEMVADYGSERRLAEELKKSVAWINQRVGLTKLDPDLQGAVEDGRISFKLARECGRLHSLLQPKLAEGELPDWVARQWLLELRLSGDDQIKRFTAGAPFDVHPEKPQEPFQQPPDRRASLRAQPKPAMVIKLMERSPVAIADALASTLSSDELAEVVQVLSSRAG